MLVASFVEGKPIRFDFGELFNKAGQFVIVTGVLHWIFDYFIKGDLFEEVAQATIGYAGVARSGIVEYLENSRAVDYSTVIENAQCLVIGQNYSPRIIDDYIENFRRRAKSGRSTQIVVLSGVSPAREYLASERPVTAHIQTDLAKVKSTIQEINSTATEDGLIELVEVETILRYAFVWTESGVWIKPQRNAVGKVRMWAFRVGGPSELFDFFSRDIADLIAQAHGVAKMGGAHG